jgi:lipopolysaccharide transport system ATP-binding protein
MSNTVIKVENLSKQYRLGELGTGTISHDLNRWWHKIRGNEDPYLKIGETNDRATKGNSEYVWALRDINFEVNQGEVLGIIGKNGAGKSTLLKLLSRVTSPSTGSIKAKGRIASLLEVGTGFHEELTGRENIFLNGAILGMTKAEIRSKLDEIIAFSGTERYIDTPVKRYSSGMRVRLAFAVAAHLDPEILIVDEVLAVGDAEFQKKAIGKMQDISQTGGRTVLFVSHNMTAIANLCTKAVVLINGNLHFNGDIKNALDIYLNINEEKNKFYDLHDIINDLPEDAAFELIDIKVHQSGVIGNEFTTDKEVLVKINYKIKQKLVGLRVGVDFVSQSTDQLVFRSFHDDLFEEIETIEPGVYESNLIIYPNLLNVGSYYLKLAVGIHNVRWIIHDQLKIELVFMNTFGINRIYAENRPGLIMPKLIWKTFNSIY